MGAVGCAAVAGAAGSAVSNALDEGADHSVGGYAKSAAGGAALGVVTLGAGKALAPVVAKLAAPLKTAAGNAAGKLASKARTTISGLKSGCSSFAGVTTVLMADGSQKAIEDIQPGDKVLATDPETGEQAGKEVTQVRVHDDTLIDLAVDGEVITTTEDHPFYNLTDGLFERADDIDPGEQVLTDTGRAVTVKGLNPASAYTALAYNLTVAGIHTYHVGNQHILVHNTTACDPTAETFFRTMSKSHAEELHATGRVPATGETFISPSAKFSSDYDGTMVRFSVRSGTTEALSSVGVRDTSAVTARAFPDMPIVSPGWSSTSAYFKGEGSIFNIGLGSGSGLDIFNRAIQSFGVVP